MLAVIAWALREWRGVGELRVLARPENVPRLGVSGVEVRAMLPARVGGWGWVATAARGRMARDGAALVLGGGSVLHSQNSIGWKARMVRRFRALGRGPVGALGVSLGPFRTGDAERACASLLRSLDFLVVRDRVSWELASAGELPYTPELAPDISVLLPVLRGWRRAPGAERPGRLGVSLKGSSQDAPGQAGPVEGLAQALREVVAAGRFREIALLEFCGDRVHGDRAALEGLRRALGPTVPTVYEPYRPDPLDMLAVVSRCEGLLGMRLHSQVFAVLAGVPFVGIGYHRKSGDVLDLLGEEGALLREDEAAHQALVDRLSGLGRAEAARRVRLDVAAEQARSALARALEATR